MTEQFGDGPEVYHGYSVDDEDQPQSFGDSLADDRGLVEPLDEGYSPPDRWSSGQRFGNTAFEEETGETLDQRLAQEEPEVDPYEWRRNGDRDQGRRVGGFRAGHLLAYDPGLGEAIVERDPRTDEIARPEAGQEPSWGRQVGGRRAGRLLGYDAGPGMPGEKDVVAWDVGIDGAGASAEEAAVHLIDDDAWPDR